MAKTTETKETTVLNAQIKVGRVIQTADDEFGIKAKETYVMLLITDKGQHKMSVGKETYEKVKELTK